MSKTILKRNKYCNIARLYLFALLKGAVGYFVKGAVGYKIETGVDALVDVVALRLLFIPLGSLHFIQTQSFLPCHEL